MEEKRTDKNSNELLIFIYKHFKIFVYTAIIAGAGSIIISFLLPVLYESSAIVFPTATSTVSFSVNGNKEGAMSFGAEDQAQQLIQILKSGPMRNRIISEFDLAKDYDIDTNAASFNYKLGKAYDNHISYSRTQYGSILISVLDKKPKVAAKIANRIVLLIDTVTNNIIKERTVPAFKINKRKLYQLKDEQKTLNTQIDSLSKLGVVDKKSRVELYKSLNTSKDASTNNYIKKQIEVNQKYGSQYDALVGLRTYRTENITNQEVSYEQAESDAHEEFIHKFVVQKASPSDKKAKPKRAIIVLVSTFSVLILVLIVLLIRDRIKEIKQAL